MKNDDQKVSEGMKVLASRSIESQKKTYGKGYRKEMQRRSLARFKGKKRKNLSTP